MEALIKENKELKMKNTKLAIVNENLKKVLDYFEMRFDECINLMCETCDEKRKTQDHAREQPHHELCEKCGGCKDEDCEIRFICECECDDNYAECCFCNTEFEEGEESFMAGDHCVCKECFDGWSKEEEERKGGFCVKHGTTHLDCWYDCEKCCQDNDKENFRLR